MNPRFLLWISAPIALSAGVIWLSAQEPKGDPRAAAAEGVKVAELASQLQNREKALALAHRNHLMLVRLKERRALLHAREQELREAIEMDEIAVMRHHRQTA